MKIQDIATVSALIVLGYVVGQGQASRNLEFSSSQLSAMTIERDKFALETDKQRDMINSLSSELLSVKAELALNSTASINDLIIEELSDTKTINETSDKDGSQKNKRLSQSLTLKQGTSVSVNDDLFVSLIKTSYDGSPLRNQVYGSVGATGKETVNFRGVDIGYTITYNNYEIRLLDASTFEATFRVTRLN